MKRFEKIALWINENELHGTMRDLFDRYTGIMPAPAGKLSYQQFADSIKYCYERGLIHTITPSKQRYLVYSHKKLGVPKPDPNAPAPAVTLHDLLTADTESVPQDAQLPLPLEPPERDYLAELYALASEAFYNTNLLRYSHIMQQIINVKEKVDG